jgi:hypothetical protein
MEIHRDGATDIWREREAERLRDNATESQKIQREKEGHRDG